MFVGRRQRDQRHVERNAPGREQRRHIGQEDRHEKRAAFLDRSAHAVIREERIGNERVLVARFAEAARAAQVQVEQLDIFQIGALHHRVQQRRRGGGSAVDEDLVTALEVGDDVARADRALLPARISLHETALVRGPSGRKA